MNALPTGALASEDASIAAEAIAIEESEAAPTSTPIPTYIPLEEPLVQTITEVETATADATADPTAEPTAAAELSETTESDLTAE